MKVEVRYFASLREALKGRVTGPPQGFGFGMRAPARLRRSPGAREPSLA